MLVNATVQMLWITYSTVTDDAAGFYGVGPTAIGFFSMVFMIAFLPLSIPGSWLIDRHGLRLAVGLGSVLAAAGGIARGLSGTSYAAALASTVVIAAAQPLLMNSWTTLAGKWFAHEQRALAVSLVTLASLVGTAVGGVLTPALMGSMPLDRIQLVLGACAGVSALLFVALARDTPRGHTHLGEAEAKALVTTGIRHALSVRPFLVFLVCAFVGIGIFNGVSTWIEQIVGPRGFTRTDAGNLVALLIGGGVVGALALGALSDRSGRRVPWVVLGLGVAVPFLLGFTLASSMWELSVCAFFVGAFLTGATPVGMQYASEVAAPTPEGTSNGLIQLAGQASFVIVLLMAVTRTESGAFTISLLALTAALAGCALLMSRQPEPDPALHVPGDLD